MNLLGLAVKHKVYGKGVITDLCENKLTVCFSKSQKSFLFPDAIPQYLTLQNSTIQKKIERINEARELETRSKEQQLKKEKEYQTRLYTMKILPQSQAAFHISPDDDLTLEYLETGYYISGNRKGEPRVPANIRPNSAIILTSCSGSEDSRVIIGIVMVHEQFWGNECIDGRIELHEKHRLLLPADHQLPFWNYFDQKTSPTRWGNTPFKYFQVRTMEKILIELCQSMIGSPQENAVLELYQYFCKRNRLTEKYEKQNLPKEMETAGL